ncbi:MAG: riboflavin synthase subunit alpha [Actinobacteria bacterium 13_1_20CM_3_68_9]|jgi:riboflavin synthase|nr:MAG: riboflavin synthase subunit alpha [Actinobacteria bacterium 13_1_20CM_3_68_9]
MFTGIVREIGTVEEVERSERGASLRVRAGLAAALAAGDSVSVSGACLTVASVADGAFAADVMNQTLALTTLGGLGVGGSVNLEPPLRAGDPLGGHLVQGHVDGTGEVRAVGEDGLARRLLIAPPPELGRFIVERGSVTVDGVSLTVAALAEEGFEVSLVPETLERTTLGGLAEGSRVNLEVDAIARYAERLMQGFETKEGR